MNQQQLRMMRHPPVPIIILDTPSSNAVRSAAQSMIENYSSFHHGKDYTITTEDANIEKFVNNSKKLKGKSVVVDIDVSFLQDVEIDTELLIS